MRRRFRVVPATRWWQVTHSAVELSCPACAVALRPVGLWRALLLGMLAFLPWLWVDLVWSPQGLYRTAFVLSLVLPGWLTWLAFRAWVRLELSDPRQRAVPYCAVRPGPAPHPELPPHLGWLRVIAPDVLPLYQRLTRVALWGLGLPLLVMAVAVPVLGSFAPVTNAAFSGLGVVLLSLLALLALGCALPAVLGFAFLHCIASGRAGPHLRRWWTLRSALFVAACLAPAILFAFGAADLIRFALLAFERGAT